jgi:hypothetical protein
MSLEAWMAGWFVAPTSAGISTPMLAPGRPSAVWLYGKGCIVTIVDNLDTVLLTIPLHDPSPARIA